MATPLTCPGCGEREGVRLVLGYPNPAARAEIDSGDAVWGGCFMPYPPPPRPWVDTACRACGAQWSSEAKPSR